MGRRKDMFLIIDTETCNSIEQPLPYDIGYCICDRYGNIEIERSFIVAEIFLDLAETMKSAYYSEKIPTYWKDIHEKKREVRTALGIRKQIHEDMKAYGVKKVCAYNMSFDKRALNNLIRYTTKSRNRWFFPFGIEYICIWHMSCQTILNTRTYIKFAEQNGLVSEKGNIQTGAEACYRFLKNQLDFIESHTGLEDVKIEAEIFAKCMSIHKKIDRGINCSCWRIPQKKSK